MQVIFSKTGRIFFGGSSGRVKFVDYFKSQLLGFTISEKFRAKEGFKWKDKLKQTLPLLRSNQNVLTISVDDTRQILYALIEITTEPTILQTFTGNSGNTVTQRVDIYDLGPFDEDFTFIGSLARSQFTEQLLLHSSNNFRLQPSAKELNIVSVSAIDKTASIESFFLLVTQGGIRAYYSLQTKLVTDRKGQTLNAQECKEAKERYGMFEKNRPTCQCTLLTAKGMVDIQPQPSQLSQLHIFYDPKDCMVSKNNYLSVDEEDKKQIKTVFNLPSGLVFQKQDNGSNRLMFLSTNESFVARMKENMFINHRIFSDILPTFAVASEKIGEIPLDVSKEREVPQNFLSDIVISQIPDKNLLPLGVSRLLQMNSFESLEASQLIGEQGGQQSFLCLNDLSRQSYCLPNHFVVLTSRGILLSYMQRPIDILFQVVKVLPEYIAEPNPPQEQININSAKINRINMQQNDIQGILQQQKKSCLEFFEQFFITYGITETFAMLTQMLCHSHLEYYQNLNVHNHLDKQLKQKLITGIELNNTSTYLQGTQYDLIQGGSFNNFSKSNKNINQQPQLQNVPETIISEISESILKKAHFLFQKYGDIILEEGGEDSQTGKQQANSELANTLGKAWEWSRRKNTSKIEGILLYFSRLIRPFWNRSLINGYAFKYIVNEPSENFQRDEVQVFTRRLGEFKFWLENETKLIYCNDYKESSLGYDKIDQLSNIQKNSQSRTSLKFEIQEMRQEEARLIEQMNKFSEKAIQVANLFLFVSENKLRQNLNNIVFREYREEMLNLRFKDMFGEKKYEKLIKDYVLSAIKLDPKYIDQARLVLQQFGSIFHQRDFSISQAEIKLQAILAKLPANAVPDTKYLNECTSVLLSQIEHLTNEYLEKFYSVYAALDSRVDFVAILLECLKFQITIRKNISNECSNKSMLTTIIIYLERQKQQTQIMEEQLRIADNFTPINKYSEQIKVYKQILDENFLQRGHCLQKLVSIIEELHIESQQPGGNNKQNKEGQILSIIKIVQNYPLKKIHVKVIETLLKNKRKADILALNSPFTELELKSESADCLKIKYKYLEQKGNVREAYSVAFQISNYKNQVNQENSQEDVIILSDRIDFTEIAIFNISLIINDYNITAQEKQNFEQERDILLKQLKVLNVQKRIHNKLNLSLSIIESRLKTIKDSQKRRQFEESKEQYKESYKVLQYHKLDESNLDKYFIQPLNLVEYSLILQDLLPDASLPQSCDKLYEQLMYRMSSPNNFEAENWPQNMQQTLSMLNKEIDNKAKLFSLQTIIVKGESINVEISYQQQISLKPFLDIFSSLLSNREDASQLLLNSPFWLPHFLVVQLNFSPLALMTIYNAIWNIFLQAKGNKESIQNYIHLSNCMMLLLKHSVSYISQVLQNHQEKSKELITIRNSILTIESILDSFNSQVLKVIKDFASGESEYIQYSQQFERVSSDLRDHIINIEQLNRDYEQPRRRGFVNSMDSFEIQPGSSLSAAKNLFNFDQDIIPSQSYSDLPRSSKQNIFNNDASTTNYPPNSSQQYLLKNPSFTNFEEQEKSATIRLQKK